MNRRDATAVLLRDRGELLVVAGLGSPSYDVHAAGNHPGNYFLWGAMGGAAVMGLGLALAQPGRPVLVVTGDGEALMGLGSLATIGARQPPNLTVAVLDNQRYGETGAQHSHTALGVDLAGVARAAGIATVLTAGSLDEVEAMRAAMHGGAPGPRFFQLHVELVAMPRCLPVRDAVWQKHRFRAHLGLPPS